MTDVTTNPGRVVGLSPVDGKNLAGDEEEYTTAERDTRSDKTKGLNATHQFEFEDVASGAYTLDIPDGWRAMVGEMGAEDDKFDDELDPLDGNLQLDVTPATATIYGRVSGSDGFAVDSATVTVDGMSAMTDDHAATSWKASPPTRSSSFRPPWAPLPARRTVSRLPRTR